MNDIRQLRQRNIPFETVQPPFLLPLLNNFKVLIFVISSLYSLLSLLLLVIFFILLSLSQKFLFLKTQIVDMMSYCYARKCRKKLLTTTCNPIFCPIFCSKEFMGEGFSTRFFETPRGSVQLQNVLANKTNIDSIFIFAFHQNITMSFFHNSIANIDPSSSVEVNNFTGERLGI